MNRTTAAVLVGVSAALLLAAAVGVMWYLHQRSTDYPSMPTEVLIDLMRTRREHQAQSRWVGSQRIAVDQDGYSISGSGGLAYLHHSSAVIDELYIRLRLDPPLLIDELGSDDSEVAITVMWFYLREAAPGSIPTIYEASSGTTVQVADAIRRNLLTSHDVRLRWLALEWLAAQPCVTVPDLVAGFADRDDTIRCKAADAAYALRETLGRRVTIGDQKKQAVRLYDQDNTVKKQLIEVLIAQLNDPHPQVRAKLADELWNLLRRPGESALGLPPGMPDLDLGMSDGQLPPAHWVHAGWAERDRTQKQIARWWADHADEAIAWSSATAQD